MGTKLGLVLTAVGVSLSPVGWVVAFVAINLALILPTTPAQLGVLEMGAVAALRMLGVDENAALAFALLYHASHVVPPTLVEPPPGIVALFPEIVESTKETVPAFPVVSTPPYCAVFEIE